MREIKFQGKRLDNGEWALLMKIGLIQGGGHCV